MFSAVAEPMGVDYQTAVKVSSGFGGGMYLGSVCGAVTGGIMALGVKYGGVGREPQVKAALLGRVFADRFIAMHKTINCPELIGVDLSKIDLTNPESYKDLNQKKIFASCLGYVKDAAAIVNEMVNTPPKA